MPRIDAAETPMNSARYGVGWMNNTDSATAVPRSVTNVAAMMILPIPVSVSPVSTNTA